METTKLEKETTRNRKRGRGKIKITKREKVNNEELKKELIAYINSKPRKASERLGEIFIDLVDNKKIELEVWKDYITKHFSKLWHNKEYCLSRVCLNWVGGLGSYSDYLAGSSDGGRVVISRRLK